VIQSRVDGSGDGLAVVVATDNVATDAAVDFVVVDDSAVEVATAVVVDNLASAAMGEAALVPWSSKISKRSVPGLD